MPDPADGVSPQAFRTAFARLGSGVSVVSAPHDGILHAMTATAVVSVSLEPPLVCVCVGHRTRFLGAIVNAGRWSVSVLAADQTHLAEHFSTSGRDLATQFDTVPHELAPHSGGAWITGAASWLDCTTVSTHEAGDHTVVLGRVLGSSVADLDPGGLVHRQGRFVPLR